METLTVLVADDDAVSRSLLCHFIRLLPQYKVIGEAASGEEFIQLVLREKPDIVLVDIHMPDSNGLEAVKSCKEMYPALQVIFTTGYDEFAVEAFNISAVDYIVKPVERTRLFNALEKARSFIRLSREAEYFSTAGKNKKLIIKSQNTFLFIPMKEILFIEKEGRKTVIHTCDERYETNETLQELSTKLDDYFYKTHRSFLVNLKKVVKIESAGETFLAHFPNSNKVAHVSKLKINKVQEKILQYNDA
ncbi:LytR/AlgR family response regulator transcription factor [Bacillus alveayuensis]|uniref:LytR/AlgR family response regulator transcription factor n=1 Tax=Aeribacillus alveayuensis TaxID=279215 RepID=UPI0005CD0612|nr:LytTR family DNA-binding domain-containing protein [Bacillus alveayuensis]